MKYGLFTTRPSHPGFERQHAAEGRGVRQPGIVVLRFQQRAAADKGLSAEEWLYVERATETVQTYRLRRMMNKDCIETAYAFLHQKRNVYIHSSLEWQKDDIEYAIATYVDSMNGELYEAISGGQADFLRDHRRFQEDITIAVEQLEKML